MLGGIRECFTGPALIVASTQATSVIMTALLRPACPLSSGPKASALRIALTVRLGIVFVTSAGASTGLSPRLGRPADPESLVRTPLTWFWDTWSILSTLSDFTSTGSWHGRSLCWCACGIVFARGCLGLIDLKKVFCALIMVPLLYLLMALPAAF